MYDCLAGVTGTLSTLNKTELTILRDEYMINKHTFMPSVYGANQVHFARDSSDDVKILPQHKYEVELRKEIIARRNSTKGGRTDIRPVLVFFKTKEALLDFYNPPGRAADGEPGVEPEPDEIDVMKDLREMVRVMTAEDTKAEQKEALIRQAVQPRQITFLTRDFGRGTDFKCESDDVEKNGGVHVIQTFVSESLAEDTQIRGRTGRMSNKGSYSMVLRRRHMEVGLQPPITAEDVEIMRDQKSWYSTIIERRDAYLAGIMADKGARSAVENAHKASVEFIEGLTGQTDTLAAGLLKTRASPPFF